jgi:hypothetical protein
MKKIAFILAFLAFFLFACDDDENKTDSRDKYVGHYEGVGHKFNNPPYNSTVDLVKHLAIDNALILNCSYAGGNTLDQDEYKKNRIYISDKGLIYQSDMTYWDLYLYKTCCFIEPDSLYCTAYFAGYNEQTNQIYYDSFTFKGKKTN